MNKLKTFLGVVGLLTMISVCAWKAQTAPVVVNEKYEYQVLADPTTSFGLDAGIARLNQLGAAGWQLTAVSDGKVYLKRVITR